MKGFKKPTQRKSQKKNLEFRRFLNKKNGYERWLGVHKCWERFFGVQSIVLCRPEVGSPKGWKNWWENVVNGWIFWGGLSRSPMWVRIFKQMPAPKNQDSAIFYWCFSLGKKETILYLIQQARIKKSLFPTWNPASKPAKILQAGDDMEKVVYQLANDRTIFIQCHLLCQNIYRP